MKTVVGKADEGGRRSDERTYSHTRYRHNGGGGLLPRAVHARDDCLQGVACRLLVGGTVGFCYRRLRCRGKIINVVSAF